MRVSHTGNGWGGGEEGWGRWMDLNAFLRHSPRTGKVHQPHITLRGWLIHRCTICALCHGTGPEHNEGGWVGLYAKFDAIRQFGPGTLTKQSKHWPLKYHRHPTLYAVFQHHQEFKPTLTAA